MTQDMVETFLMILKYRNITAAAQSLYTSQGTVSHRLRLLEQEVGAQLFVRQKGHRTVEPTQAGEDFVELAELWHDRFWPSGKSLITVSMGDQMSLYLDVPGRWAIVPASVSQTLRDSQSLACYALTEAPPDLCCYEIRHRYPRQSTEGQVELLRQEVRAFVRSNDSLLQA